MAILYTYAMLPFLLVMGMFLSDESKGVTACYKVGRGFAASNAANTDLT